MVAKSLCLLLLTLLNISFNVNGAEVTRGNDGKIEELNLNTRKHIEDFIKAQVQIDVGGRKAELTDAEYNIDKDIKDTVDGLMSYLYKDTKQIIDKFNSAYREAKILEAIGKIDNRLVVIEDKSKVTDQDIQNLITVTEQVGICCSGSVPNVPKDQKCAVNVPSSVQTSDDTWIPTMPPNMDDLDTYLNQTKGCTYRAVPVHRAFSFPGFSFAEATIEIHFAVRAEGIATLRVWWKTAEYTFEFGLNTTKVINSKVYPEETLVNLPKSVISPNTYTHFYVRIEKDSITFGRICGGVDDQIFKDNITSTDEDKGNVRFDSYHITGGKIVHNCPAGVLETK